MFLQLVDLEQATLALLAAAWTAERGTKYGIEWLDQAKREYEDGFLLGPGGPKDKVGVQVRHFDGELIGKLRAKGEIAGFALQLGEAVERAIAAKARVSESVRNATVLLAPPAGFD